MYEPKFIAPDLDLLVHLDKGRPMRLRRQGHLAAKIRKLGQPASITRRTGVLGRVTLKFSDGSDDTLPVPQHMLSAGRKVIRLEPLLKDRELDWLNRTGTVA